MAATLLLLTLAACARLSTPQGWSGGVVAEDVSYGGASYDTALYIGTMEGDVRALDMESGYGLGFASGREFDDWRFALRGEEEQNRAIYGTPALDGGVLYAAGYDGLLYAVCLDGRPIDEVTVGRGLSMVGGPVVAHVDDTTVVLVGSSDGALYAFDFTDGGGATPCDGPRFVERWVWETGNKVWSSAVVKDGIVYFGSLDHKVYALRLRDGGLAWDAPFSTGGAITATPVIDRGTLYVGSFDGVFYAIDATTGTETARFEGASGWFWGNPVAGDGAIYAPSLDGKLYALDMATLELDWSFETMGPLIGAPTIIGDRIVIPSVDKSVYLVNLISGQEEDSCDVGSEVRASLTSHGDAIYLQAEDHSIRMMTIERYSAFWRLEEGWRHNTDSEGDPVTRWGCGSE